MPLRFAGQRQDSETGIAYNYLRDCYDAAIGRFCQSDPIGLAGGINTYSYAAGSPIGDIDPFGLYESSAVLRAVVPGQASWDNAITAWQSQRYGWAALYVGAMLSEQVATALTFGAYQAARAAASQCFANTIEPSTVRFSQSSIGKNFSTGGSVDDLAAALKAGRTRASDVPPIRLVEKEGQLFSLDNRRLEAFRRADVEVPYRMATPQEVATEAWKFTTRNGGTSVRIRGE